MDQAGDDDPAHHFEGRLGLQLYSLRAEFATNVPATLDLVRSYGFTDVELAGTYGMSPEQFRQELDKRGLKAVSGHFAYDRFRDDPEGIVKDAKALGMQYAGCAWISHDGDFDEKECRDAIAVFNHAGEVLAKNGLKFFYHTHGYEFQPYEQGTLFDLLMEETKPDLVSYEMDVFWIKFPGQDPAALLRRFPSRWSLMHVKGMKMGLKGDLSGHTDVSNDVAIGTGQMAWPGILDAARDVGVKYYFIEDESPDSVQQIPQSVQYLKNVTW